MPRLNEDIVLVGAEEEKLGRRLEELHGYRTTIQDMLEQKEGAMANHMRVLQQNLEKRVCTLAVRNISGNRTEANGRSEEEADGRNEADEADC